MPERNTVQHPDLPAGASRKLLSAGEVLRWNAKDLGNNYDLFLKPVIAFADRHLPWSGCGLEMHFDRGDTWFDFLFRINPDYDRALLCHASFPYLSKYFPEERIRPLIRPQTGSFSHGIQNIWFEFDAPFQDTPGLFFDPLRDEPYTESAIAAAMTEICPCAGCTASPFLLSFLRRLDEVNLRSDYIGFMLSRPQTPIRLTTAKTPAGRLKQTLSACSWPGDMKPILSWQSDFLHETDRLALALDLDDRLLPALGIECYPADNAAMIERLSEKKLIGDEQRRFLMDWEGIFDLPAEGARQLSALYDRDITEGHRRINHFKFSFTGGRPKAKAYLYYCF